MSDDVRTPMSTGEFLQRPPPSGGRRQELCSAEVLAAATEDGGHG